MGEPEGYDRQQALDAYRQWLQPAHWPGHGRRTAEGNAAFFLPHLRPGMTLLDAGCGVGTITVGLAEAVAGAGATRRGEAVGIDANEGAIREARDRAAAQGVVNVRFEVADVHSLPFNDAEFDAVFCHGVLEHLTEPVSVVREFRRVLRPGGVIGVAEADLDTQVVWPRDPLLERSVTLVERLWAESGGWGYPSGQGSDLRVGKRLRDFLHEAGFMACVGTASAACDGSSESTRLAAECEARYLEAAPLVEHAVLLGIATREELRLMADAWRYWGSRPGAFRLKCVCQAVAWA